MGKVQGKQLRMHLQRWGIVLTLLGTSSKYERPSIQHHLSLQDSRMLQKIESKVPEGQQGSLSFDGGEVVLTILSIDCSCSS